MVPKEYFKAESNLRAINSLPVSFFYPMYSITLRDTGREFGDSDFFSNDRETQTCTSGVGHANESQIQRPKNFGFFPFLRRHILVEIFHLVKTVIMQIS